MQCPVDGETLQMAERQGVEVDYCPKCRGVWLDRGELDKIIERSAEHQGGGEGGERRDRDRERGEGRRKPKRESFLSEIFDF
ncbi:zf-TFIIB domain-containing protein [Halorhodospira neutriphila]|uniref:Transcription factor zinc-finger domain-containing protein n=1 Tax=Halorhodospira neutriphila TaxID=168379 RepID=A0ABS1E503_9GAMM|nr:zf-TFIIB domain-containing protein [Halorhodospira neutriphila]MBK1726826.1 hypothetical protein [Halorhodospira neutriphila]